MPSRTAYAGTAVAGDVYTAANHAKMPGGWIGYVETTTAQSGISTETDLTGLSVTVTVGTNRRIRVSCHVNLQYTTGGAADTIIFLHVKEGATYLGGQRWQFKSDTTLNQQQLFNPAVVLTPTAGSHTYKLSTVRNTGTLGTISTNANANFPAFILVEDLGPAT